MQKNILNFNAEFIFPILRGGKNTFDPNKPSHKLNRCFYYPNKILMLLPSSYFSNEKLVVLFM